MRGRIIALIVICTVSIVFTVPSAFLTNIRGDKLDYFAHYALNDFIRNEGFPQNDHQWKRLAYSIYQKSGHILEYKVLRGQVLSFIHEKSRADDVAMHALDDFIKNEGFPLSNHQWKRLAYKIYQKSGHILDYKVLEKQVLSFIHEKSREDSITNEKKEMSIDPRLINTL